MDERDDRRGGGSSEAANPQRFPARLTGAVLVLVGLAHLLAPGALLWTARIGYRYVLRVDFDPKAGASGRVRVLGLAMIAAGAHLLYHGGVVPRGRGRE